MKRTKVSKLTFVVVCALAGLVASVALADTMQQSDSATVSQGSATCTGTYYALAKMTNSTGTFYITPPSGTHNGTFSDMSGMGGSYRSVVSVIRKSDGTSFCTGSNSVAFPASSSSYLMTVYVTSRGITNSQPLTLQVVWQ